MNKKMNRTQIYINTEQQRILRRVAAEKRTTISYLIREAIQELVLRYKKPRADPIDGIVGMYSNPKDREGSTRHDDIYD